MILNINKTTDPILREKATKVTDFGHDFQIFIDNMIETMRKYNGIGLAAPQVGVSKQVFICEFTGDKELNFDPFPLTVICNPEIIFYSKNQKKMVEGCLSFPGVELLIKRPNEIKIKGQDRHGKDIEISADKLFARVIQHEFDHLNSTLLIDRLEIIETIFIGTGDFGLKTLEMLASDPQYKIISVISSKPKPIVGRKKEKNENKIIELAKKCKIPYEAVSNIKDEDLIKKIEKMHPEIGVMVDFGQILSEKILNIPKYGIINIHPSLLPKHRGPSPIQQTILDGDERSGVTLIKTSPKMDAGDIISQVIVKLSNSETYTTLKDYLAEIAAPLLLNSIPYYIAGDLKPIKQNENEATYSKIFKKDDGFVDLSTPKREVERKIRAFDSWPKVHTIKDGKRIQLLASHLDEKGNLVIDCVKPEGKNEMSYEEYLRGYKEELTFN